MPRGGRATGGPQIGMDFHFAHNMLCVNRQFDQYIQVIFKKGFPRAGGGKFFLIPVGCGSDH